MMDKLFTAMAGLALLQAAPLPAVEGVVTTELDPVVVSADTEKLAPLINQDFGQIYASKKVSRNRIAEQPQGVSGEFRNLFKRTPGVYVSEMGADPSVVNLTIRGIGEPHETQDVGVFQNGIPIGSTLFGYPTLYYAPANEFIEEVEVFKGGSSLLYGPQPAGVVNFITRDPVPDRPFQYDQTTLFGSHGTISTYQQVSGTSASGQAGYLASFYHRQSDGFRAVNSDYKIFNGNVKLFWDISEDTRLELEYSAYDEETGEAGRMSYAQWLADPNQVLPGNVNDRLFLRKHFGAVTLTRQLSPEAKVITKTFGHYQQRLTRRNNGAATRTDVDDRLFRAVGNDTRFIYDYAFFDGEVDSTFTGGWTTYYSNDPNRRNRLGAVTLSTTGLPVREHQNRETFYQALFAENIFEIGALRLIPSVRVDLVSMHQRNNAGNNVGVTGDEFHVEPLAGFGIEYDLPAETVAYFNFAQSYQPLQYDQVLNRGAAVPTTDTRPGETNTFELGVKGTPANWFTFDVSGFHVDYRDFIDVNEDGNNNTVAINAGDVEFYGIDIAFDFNASSFIDEHFDTVIEDTVGTFGFFSALEILTSEIVNGPSEGNEASYAPTYTAKFGPTYRHDSGIKAELTATYVDKSFWNTRNSSSLEPGGFDVGTNIIDCYSVWDLAFEIPIYRDHVRLIFGINNLFDEKYYARVRADGIQPTDGRNYYGGFSTTF
jgi:Fe(3+) dicitrate transport protein